jgi:hypothetical protein
MQPEDEVWMEFHNDQDTPMTFVLEPWGVYYEMKPQEQLRLCLQSSLSSSPANPVHVIYSVKKLTVYAGDGRLASLFSSEGEELN